MSRLARFGNRLVIIFRRKQESRRKDAGSIEQHNNQLTVQRIHDLSKDQPTKKRLS